MDRISLFEEYRLIERDESEVNGAWKGAHLLLFFMAFVFGSFCTFCFHMLMYLFDEKCVLFPKLQSLTAMKHNVIYEFIPVDKDESDQLPVDFLSSQWVEKSACYLPTYVPLMSGIFGLIWTTMFLMCSTGTRTHTGLQRPWRVLPPVFVFSLVMSALCIYSSAVTHYGLNELCLKLGEITGSPTCSYTVNVATLAYERRIRGVYQAIRLTIVSAWLHTMCWLLSAALTLLRVGLAVDFQLVRIKVTLIADIDKMLEHQETQLRTVSPEQWINEDNPSETSMSVPVHSVHFSDANTEVTIDATTQATNEDTEKSRDAGVLYVSKAAEHASEHSLVPLESHKLARISASAKYPKGVRFIVKLLYDLLLTIAIPESESESSPAEESSESLVSDSEIQITRQYGQQRLNRGTSTFDNKSRIIEPEAESTEEDLRNYIEEMLKDRIDEFSKDAAEVPSSSFHLYSEMKKIIESKPTRGTETTGQSSEKTVKKSNLKSVKVQTKKSQKSRPQVHYSAEQAERSLDETTETTQDVAKETQTKKEKEKQD